jgi:hypothetical protein
MGGMPPTVLVGCTRSTSLGEVIPWSELVAGLRDLAVWRFQRLRMRKAGEQEGDQGRDFHKEDRR